MFWCFICTTINSIPPGQKNVMMFNFTIVLSLEKKKKKKKKNNKKKKKKKITKNLCVFKLFLYSNLCVFKSFSYSSKAMVRRPSDAFNLEYLSGHLANPQALEVKP